VTFEDQSQETLQELVQMVLMLRFRPTFNAAKNLALTLLQTLYHICNSIYLECGCAVNGFPGIFLNSIRHTELEWSTFRVHSNYYAQYMKTIILSCLQVTSYH